MPVSDAYTLCKTAAAEGTVLLKNEGALLPLDPGTRLAVFGRMQTSYYRSGTGSGGGVYLSEIPCVLTSLRARPELILDETLIRLYAEWEKQHPFDDGGGVWAGEPWFQEEMFLDETIAKQAAASNDAALILIGRTAGEDHDNADVQGSYRLTDTEEQMLDTVCRYFRKVVVALNTGNLIDLSFLDRYAIQSLLYIWQGGMAGADAFAEILCGVRYPSGKLSDTQLFSLTGHPADSFFTDSKKIPYREDIYVGYRYFETFAKEAVRYPFGYGLGYTRFETTFEASCEGGSLFVNAGVKNIGGRQGKETVQIYFGMPCGEYGAPDKQLAAFMKTKELNPGEEQTLRISFPAAQMAFFDDTGITGQTGAYVLPEGKYPVYAGTDVRHATLVFVYENPHTRVIDRPGSAMAPCEDLEVIKAVDDGSVRTVGHRTVQGVRAISVKSEQNGEVFPFTGDTGIRLADVASGKYGTDAFLAQLTDAQLASLVCGEGMSSPKGTPGAAGALGGLTEALSAYGIPVCAVADGPSGLKLQKGVPTTLTPNGTMLGCTWNAELVEELFGQIGSELKEHEVDALLGPGLNIHRSPLCGRNFEYFSEDPFLTGKLGAAVTRGIAGYGCFSTVKHLCCNNREKARADYDVTVSERALREIYLKPFEIAVKEGDRVLVMTAYNAVNGFWSASNRDLTEKILREEWGFDGIVMTDWWAKCNAVRGENGSKDRLDAMVRAQNDLYMVCEDALVKSDSILKAIQNGTLAPADLRRCAKRILQWIIETNTFRAYVARGCVPKYPITVDTGDMTVTDRIAEPSSAEAYIVNVKSGKNTAFVFRYASDLDSLAQIPVTVKVDSTEFTLTVNGTVGEEKEITRFVKTDWTEKHIVTVHYANAVSLKGIEIKQKNSF